MPILAFIGSSAWYDKDKPFSEKSLGPHLSFAFGIIAVKISSANPVWNALYDPQLIVMVVCCVWNVIRTRRRNKQTISIIVEKNDIVCIHVPLLHRLFAPSTHCSL
jgi:hypothetical protein